MSSSVMSWYGWLGPVRRALTPVVVGLLLGAGLTLLPVRQAAAQHKASENDMEVPTNNPQIVAQGRAKFAERCSFCHGGDGHGGKGPCLTCGKFHYTGNTNAEIYATIAAGVSNRALGGTMGAFGTTMSMEEILSVIAFLRWEEKRRIAAGEIPDPYAEQSDVPVFPKSN